MKIPKEILLKLTIIFLCMVTVTTIYWNLALSSMYREYQEQMRNEIEYEKYIKERLWNVVLGGN